MIPPEQHGTPTSCESLQLTVTIYIGRHSSVKLLKKWSKKKCGRIEYLKTRSLSLYNIIQPTSLGTQQHPSKWLAEWHRHCTLAVTTVDHAAVIGCSGPARCTRICRGPGQQSYPDTPPKTSMTMENKTTF